MGVHLGAQEKPAAKLCTIVEQYSRRAVVEIYPEAPIKLQPPIESVELLPCMKYCNAANAWFPRYGPSVCYVALRRCLVLPVLLVHLSVGHKGNCYQVDGARSSTVIMVRHARGLVVISNKIFPSSIEM